MVVGTKFHSGSRTLPHGQEIRRVLSDEPVPGRFEFVECLTCAAMQYLSGKRVWRGQHFPSRHQHVVHATPLVLAYSRRAGRSPYPETTKHRSNEDPLVPEPTPGVFFGGRMSEFQRTRGERFRPFRENTLKMA